MTEIADTLTLMHLLDSTDEVGDCLIWNGALSMGRYPIFKKYGCGCTLVRREIFRLTKGQPMPRQPIDSKCDDKACINPAHLFQSTIAGVARKAAKRGAWRTFARKAKIAAKKRAKGKLTMESANEIRMSSESGSVLAARFGVDKSLINRVKAGLAWMDYSNPFAGLMT